MKISMLPVLLFSAFSAATDLTKFYNPYVDPNVPKSFDALGSGASCKEIIERVDVPSGVYTIAPLGEPIDVYCDMETFGGGWTLLYSFGIKPISHNALYDGGVSNYRELKASSLTHDVSHLNFSKYGNRPDALQYFRSGSPKGYIGFEVPGFASMVRIQADTGDFPGWIHIYLNEKDVKTLSKADRNSDVYVTAKGDDSVKIQENGVAWISAIWVR